MNSPTPTPLAQTVTTHGKGLAVVRRLLEDAARQAVKAVMDAWNTPPTGTALSALTRKRLRMLVGGNEELAETGVIVKFCGEDWVRVWLAEPGWEIHLRTCPPIVPVGQEPGLFGREEFAVPRGTPFLFWRFDTSEDQLSFSMALVANPDWVIEAYVYDVVEITDLETGTGAVLTPPGTGNDDDDLNDLLGRDDDEPQSEAEANDDKNEDSNDDERGTAMGEDGN